MQLVGNMFEGLFISLFSQTCVSNLMCTPWVIPNEKKTEKNWPPLKVCFLGFFMITGLVYDDLGHFWPPGSPRVIWGALGGFGGLEIPNLSISTWDQFQPWDVVFWVKTTCHTMFLTFWAKIGPPGPKKAIFGQNRVCREVDFPENCPLKFV